MTVKLKATKATAARSEARKYAPCALRGYDANGAAVYITAVRAKGDKHPVATATRPGHKAVSFEIETLEVATNGK